MDPQQWLPRFQATFGFDPSNLKKTAFVNRLNAAAADLKGSGSIVDVLRAFVGVSGTEHTATTIADALYSSLESARDEPAATAEAQPMAEDNAELEKMRQINEQNIAQINAYRAELERMKAAAAAPPPPPQITSAETLQWALQLEGLKTRYEAGMAMNAAIRQERATISQAARSLGNQALADLGLGIDMPRFNPGWP